MPLYCIFRLFFIFFAASSAKMPKFYQVRPYYLSLPRQMPLRMHGIHQNCAFLSIWPQINIIIQAWIIITISGFLTSLIQYGWTTLFCFYGVFDKISQNDKNTLHIGLEIAPLTKITRKLALIHNFANYARMHRRSAPKLLTMHKIRQNVHV